MESLVQHSISQKYDKAICSRDTGEGSVCLQWISPCKTVQVSLESCQRIQQSQSLAIHRFGETGNRWYNRPTATRTCELFKPNVSLRDRQMSNNSYVCSLHSKHECGYFYPSVISWIGSGRPQTDRQQSLGLYLCTCRDAF